MVGVGEVQMSDNDKKKNTNQPDKSKSGKNNELPKSNIMRKRTEIFNLNLSNIYKDKN